MNQTAQYKLITSDGQHHTISILEKPPIGIIWESGVILTEFCNQEVNLKDKRVLELGAGTGLCSIACSILRAQVVSTDMSHAVELIQSNALRNGVAIEGRPLDWNNNIEIGLFLKQCHPFDFIIASDVLYEDRSYEALSSLLTLIPHHDGSRVILSFPMRSGKVQKFLEMLTPRFIIEEQEIKYSFYRSLSSSVSSIPCDKDIRVIMLRYT